MYDIRKRKNQYFEVIKKSITASQKTTKKKINKQKKSLAEIFCIFECLLTQNSTNQGSQLSSFFQNILRTIKKSKNREL